MIRKQGAIMENRRAENRAVTMTDGAGTLSSEG